MEENTSKVYVGTADRLLSDVLGSSLAVPGEAGSALFVINLCASMAPVPLAGKTLPGFDSYRLYQVSRVEDGRTRYRLRLGFFTSEVDAEKVLVSVRDNYPTAFTACLCDEDRRFARGYLPETALAAAIPAPKRPAPSAARPAAVTVPAPAAAKAAPAPGTSASTPVTNAGSGIANRRPATPTATSPQATDVVEVSWKPEAPVTAAAAPKKPTGDDAEIFEFTWEPPALQATAPTPTPTATRPAGTETVAPVFRTQSVLKHPEPARTPVAAAKPPVTTKATSDPVAAKNAKTSPPTARAAPIDRPAPMELTLAAEPAVAPVPTATVSNAGKPFHVGKGVEIPSVRLTLQPEAPAAAADKKPAKPTAPAHNTPIATTVAAKAATSKPAAPPPAPAAAAPAPVRTPATSKPAITNRPPPDLDSTQTIRALTQAELDDESETWFAIQLAASEHTVNLDAMPRLDIFEAYRLYSVATAGSGKIIHSLRLGFFREAVSAEAVSGYLKTFFPTPAVLRISVAEHTRFKDPPACKTVPEAKTDAKVVELNSARERAAKPTVPTVTVEVTPGPSRSDTRATGSFRTNATGTHKTIGASGSHRALNATGTHKALSTSGSHRALNATGTHKAIGSTGVHKALGSTGSHKALKSAARGAATPTKRSEPLNSKLNGKSATGKHRVVKQSLEEQLLAEAREVELSASGIRKLPRSDSLLSRLVGKLTK